MILPPPPPRPPRSIRRRASALVLAATLTASLTASLAHAQSSTPSEQPLAHLQHTTWTLKDGLAGPVMAIAQTTDGYLWLGTGAGLFRFDGVRFERFDTLAGAQLPSRQVLSLHATKDNGLWVGLLEGGAALVRQGRILHVDPAGGHFATSTRGFATQRDGTLWVATGRSLLRRQGDTWIAIGPESGYDDGAGHAPLALKIAVDGSDNLWVVTDRTVFVKAAGSARFVATEAPALGLTQLVVGADGRVWANDMSPTVRGLSRLPLPGEPAASSATPLYPVAKSFFMPAFDRQGLLWYGARDGLNRIDVSGTPAAAAASHQFLGTDKGLSGELVTRIFQDRDGAIWVGTNGGLDRFRGAAVDRIDLPDRSASIAMSADERGNLWIASGGVVQRFAPGRATPEPVPTDPGMESFTSVFTDRQGRLWVGGRTGLWRQDGPRFVQLPTPDGLPWMAAVFEIAEDAEGAVWFNGHRYGLMRYAEGRVTRLSGTGRFPYKGPDAIGTDARGRVWLGYDDGTLLRQEGDRTVALTPAEGLKIGAIKVIARQGDRLWIGGERGVQLASAPGMPMLRLADPDALDGVSGIVETPDGELWLNGANGITRLTADEVRRALAAAGQDAPRPSGRRFDLIDGLSGRAEQSWPLRTAARTPDGMLWFSLSNGVVRIDPKRLPKGETAAPPVDVQGLFVHGEPTPGAGPASRASGDPVRNGSAAGSEGGGDGDQRRLPPGTRDLEIAYTAISLAQPERTRFRYRLIGQDRAWQDAGTRRRAFYTNLGPGIYDFQVEASQDGGPWSTTPAVLRFEIAPTLTQTGWFRAAAVLVGLATLAALAALRARQRRLHEQERLAARVQERERIARDLHDTLLQGVYGLILRFEAIARRLPGTERAAMERVLTDADALLVEGRDRVTDLRLPPPDSKLLEHTLEGLGRELSHTHGAAFTLTVEGTRRPLAPALSASICLIAREAIFNAFQHAQAARIEVTLSYGDDAFALFVRDDGVGVPDEVKDRGGRPGHWGLSGMRERAELAGIGYRLTSHAGVGTEVELRAPAAQAYDLSGGNTPHTPGSGWWRRLRRG
ncbi:two-component regulator propeller domain-containing protein [Roseateles chitinivorans]|uniref:sensor histidine kinase n=1 Tax=Roseateles chitinivorans TaxID=2917965 RepID=UPI003D670B1A